MVAGGAARVAVIASESATRQLADLARDQPVWTIRTPETERATADLRRGGCDVTLFDAEDDPEAALLSIMGEVDLHHGAHSGNPVVAIDVRGTDVSDAV